MASRPATPRLGTRSRRRLGAPAKPCHRGGGFVEIGVDEVRESSASSREARAVEPTRSQNITVIGRRSAETSETFFGGEGENRGERRVQGRWRRQSADRSRPLVDRLRSDSQFFLQVLHRQVGKRHELVDPVVAKHGLICQGRDREAIRPHPWPRSTRRRRIFAQSRRSVQRRDRRRHQVRERETDHLRWVVPNHSETVSERPVFGALPPFTGKPGGLQRVNSRPWPASRRGPALKTCARLQSDEPQDDIAELSRSSLMEAMRPATVPYRSSRCPFPRIFAGAPSEMRRAMKRSL